MTRNSYVDAFEAMNGGRKTSRNKRRGRKPGPKKGSRQRKQSYSYYSSSDSYDSSSGGSVSTLLSNLLSGNKSGRGHGTKYAADILPKLPMGLSLNPLDNILSTGSSIANFSTGTKLGNLFGSIGLGSRMNVVDNTQSSALHSMGNGSVGINDANVNAMNAVNATNPAYNPASGMPY